VDPKAGLDMVKKKISNPCMDTNLSLLDCSQSPTEFSPIETQDSILLEAHVSVRLPPSDLTMYIDVIHIN
jgi:hypothetical protein